MSEVIARVLIVPDAHHPRVDKKCWNAILAYASTQKWTYVVQLGDFLDLDSLNSHNKGRPGLQEGQRLKHELEVGRSAWEDLADVSRRCNPEVALHWVLGNHEDRLVRAEHELPAWAGVASLSEAVDAERLAIRIYPYRKRKSAFRLGRLHFLHGSYSGEAALKKHLDRLSCSFVMGHTHRLATLTKPSQHGTMLAASLGYIGDKDLGESYVDGPEGWQHAFGEAYVLKNGDFFLYPIPIVRGAFVAPDGKYYSSAGWDRLGPPSLLSRSTTPASYHGLAHARGGRVRAR